jgi:hypothetical protein
MFIIDIIANFIYYLIQLYHGIGYCFTCIELFRKALWEFIKHDINNLIDSRID